MPPDQERRGDMSRAYSSDLRERVLDAVAAGRSARSAAAHFGIGTATVVRWVRRWRETGRADRPQAGPSRGVEARRACGLSTGPHCRQREPDSGRVADPSRPRAWGCRSPSVRSGASTRSTGVRLKKDRPCARVRRARRTDLPGSLGQMAACPRLDPFDTSC